MIITIKQIIILPALVAILLLSACSTALPVINAQDASAPSIKIILPQDVPDEPNIPGDALAPVLVKVTNFTLVAKLGGSNAAGEGHIHYYLDIDPLAEPARLPLFSTGKYAESSENIYYWPQIGRGPHTFWAELVNNDHTPLNPRVIARSRINAGGYSES